MSAGMFAVTTSAPYPSTFPELTHTRWYGAGHISHMRTCKCARALLCLPGQACTVFDCALKPFDFTPHVPHRMLTHTHVISTPENWKQTTRAPRTCRLQKDQQATRRRLLNHREAEHRLKLLPLHLSCHALAIQRRTFFVRKQYCD